MLIRSAAVFRESHRTAEERTMVCIKRPQCDTNEGCHIEVTVTSSEELHAQAERAKKQKREEKAASSGGAEKEPKPEGRADDDMFTAREKGGTVCVLLKRKKQKARPKGVNLKVRWRAKVAMRYCSEESARRAILVWECRDRPPKRSVGKGACACSCVRVHVTIQEDVITVMM